MVTPHRGGYGNAGNTGRSGIDLWSPEELHAAGELGALEMLERALAMIEAGRPEFHADGACRGSGLDFTNLKSQSNTAACLQICGRCVVRAECLDWALEVDDKVAVLGGMTPSARARLARDRNQSATGQPTERAEP